MDPIDGSNSFVVVEERQRSWWMLKGEEKTDGQTALNHNGRFPDEMNILLFYYCIMAKRLSWDLMLAEQPNDEYSDQTDSSAE